GIVHFRSDHRQFPVQDQNLNIGVLPGVGSNIFLPRGIWRRGRLCRERSLGNRGGQQSERLIHVAPRITVICVGQYYDCQLISLGNLNAREMTGEASAMTDAYLVANPEDTESQAPTAAPV